MRKVIVLLKEEEVSKIRPYLIKLYEVQRMIENEAHEGFFDEKLFIDLIKKIPEDKSYPPVKSIRNAFSEWTDYQELGTPVDVSIRDMILKGDILGVCILYPDELIVDHSRIGKTHLVLNEMNNGAYSKSHELNLLPCDEIIINQWFNENREPGRKFDENYLKHSRFKTRYVDGEEVSPLSIPENEIKDALKRAVGTKGQKRIYFYDSNNKMILVFYNENSLQHLFHGHSINREKKKEEEQKIHPMTQKKLSKVFGYRRG